MFFFHNLLPHCIWIDRCRARSSPVGANFHLVRQVTSKSITSGFNIAFGSTPVEPNELLHTLVMFSLDTCRSKCDAATTGDTRARHMSIQMQRGTLRWCSCSTPVDPNDMSRSLVMLLLETCRTKWNVASAGDDLAWHLSIQMWYRTMCVWSRSTPVDPNTILQWLVMLSLDTCRSICDSVPWVCALARRLPIQTQICVCDGDPTWCTK